MTAINVKVCRMGPALCIKSTLKLICIEQILMSIIILEITDLTFVNARIEKLGHTNLIGRLSTC